MAYYNNYHYSDYNHNYSYNPYMYQNQYQYHQPPPQTLVPESFYYNHDSRFGGGYQPSGYGYGYYDYGDQSQLGIAYSVAAQSDSKLVEYGDGIGGGGLDLQIVENFNGEEDEDYDPTPYGGGYDIVKMYGKPLPASEAICYRRSGNEAPVPAQGVMVVSEPVREAPEKGSMAIVPVDRIEEGGESGDDDEYDDSEFGIETESDLRHGDGDFGGNEDETEEASAAAAAEDLRLTGNGEGEGLENEERFGGVGGFGEQYGGYEYEKIVVSEAPNLKENETGASSELGFCDGILGHFPCLSKKYYRTAAGYDSAANSDSLGFCEGIFGHFPCLSKKTNGTTVAGYGWMEEKAGENQWKATADFLFGSLNPYENGAAAAAYHGSAYM